MWIKEFFYFNKSDRKVLSFLLVVGVIASGLYYGISEVKQSNELTNTADSLANVDEKKQPYRPYSTTKEEYYAIETQPKALFYFDPNTADSTQLLRLGLRSWQVRNIYRYRAAGGIYRKPTDFARLYGLTAQQYQELEPYIRIEGDYRLAAEVYENKADDAPMVRDTVHFPAKLQAHEHIDLNAADTTLLKKVPSIGSYYARQIVRYRHQLGGFVRVNQLLEIEDFPVEAISFFRLSPHAASEIRGININQLTLNQLKRHPYINYYMAKSIVDYRRLKGEIKSLDQLKLLPDFTEEVIQRLEPYIIYK